MFPSSVGAAARRSRLLRGTYDPRPRNSAIVAGERRSLLGRALAYSLIPLLIRETIQRNRVTILVYHDPAEATMLEHLRYLSRRYRIISLRDFIEAQCRNDLRSLPKKALVITFDDGYRSNHGLADLFSRKRIPATIFVCTGIVGTHRQFWFRHVPNASELERVPDDERISRLEAHGFASEREATTREALSRHEIQAMAGEIFDFQSHTISHPILPYCSAVKAKLEIVDSKRKLEEEYGFDVYALAYPSGGYSKRDCKLAREAGYRCALTVDLGFNSAKTDLFRLKRIPVGDRDSKHELIAKSCGLWELLKRLIRGRPTP
jgi:peptidoglycan/xylan/chitin deacetylase (PgdA/CDA1 family)